MSGSDSIQDAGRRNALRKIAMGASAATVFPILGQPAAAAASCHPETDPKEPLARPDAGWKPLFFDPHQNDTVITLTDLIIPQTDTPGAKAANVNRLIDLFLNEEDADVQRHFLEGLGWIDGRAQKLHQKPFIELTMMQQTALLESLADSKNTNPEDRPGMEFFQDLKDWTLFGYYTSKIGLEQELQYGGDDYHDAFPGACTHPEHQS